jgi:hypothetical protein
LQVFSLWLWLSYRFEEEYFPGRGRVVETSDRIIDFMSEGLQRMFGPTAALADSKKQREVCSRFANWTNGAKKASDMVDYLHAAKLQQEQRPVIVQAA